MGKGNGKTLGEADQLSQLIPIPSENIPLYLEIYQAIEAIDYKSMSRKPTEELSKI